MKRRKALALAGVVTLFACAIGAACTFPDVAFAPTGDGIGEAGADGSAVGSADSSSGADASSDAALIEAATRTDATTKIDASGCTSCDCDMDTFDPKGGACDGGPGPVSDCDDSDPVIKPSQTFVDDFRWASSHPIPYDWNCDGHVDKAYPVNLKCGGNVLTGCTGGQGFVGDPTCGTGADTDFAECKAVGAACTAVKLLLPRNQLCR